MDYILTPAHPEHQRVLPEAPSACERPARTGMLLAPPYRGRRRPGTRRLPKHCLWRSVGPVDVAAPAACL